MDDNINSIKKLIKLPSSASNSQLQEGAQQIIYCLTPLGCFCVYNIEHRKIIYQSGQIHQNRPRCVRNKDNLLITGGYDNTVKIFDCRNWGLVHTFQRIPGKFNALDKTQHILAGASGSDIIFWDLRKMKQRSLFNQSFNDTITHIRFQEQLPTNLLGCSLDGMISLFDLCEENEQEAFSWSYKIISSPDSFSSGNKGRVLVRTTDHRLFKIVDANFYGKIEVNHPDQPKHIIKSQFKTNTNNEVYQYFTWSPEHKVMELWQGAFLDKTNEQKCMSQLNNVQDVEVFNPISNKSGSCIGVYTDEDGNIYEGVFVNEPKSNQLKQNAKYNVKKQMIESVPIWNMKRQKNAQYHQLSEQVENKNGYILQKPPSVFSNAKKYKPY